MIKHVFIFGVLIPTVVTVVLFVLFLVCWFKFNLHGKLFKKKMNSVNEKSTTTPNGVIVETTEITQSVEYQGGDYENVGGAMCCTAAGGYKGVDQGTGGKCCQQCCQQRYCCTEQHPGAIRDSLARDPGYYSSQQSDTSYAPLDDTTVSVCQKIPLCNHEYHHHGNQTNNKADSKTHCNQHGTTTRPPAVTDVALSNGGCYTNQNLCLSPTDPERQSTGTNPGDASTLRIRDCGALPSCAVKRGETFVQQTFHFPVDSDAGSEDGMSTTYSHFIPTLDKPSTNCENNSTSQYYVSTCIETAGVCGPSITDMDNVINQ